MAKTLWVIKISGHYAGRTWQPVTHSEYDVLEELRQAGYGPELSVELGEVPTTAAELIAQL
jgi:hypothetical protein